MFSCWKKKPTRSQSLIHPNRIEYLLTTCDAHKLNLAWSPLFYLRSLCWRSAQHRFGRSEDFGNGRECGHCGEHRQAAGVADKTRVALSGHIRRFYTCVSYWLVWAIMSACFKVYGPFEICTAARDD